MKPPISFFTGLMMAIVLFVGFLLSILIFAMNQPQNLVTDNYYNEELAYQQQIDRIQRSRALGQEPSIIYQRGGKISVHFPNEWLGRTISGTVLLFRPSDSKLDQTLLLKLGLDGSQLIDTCELQPGLWKIKLNWQMDGVSYYSENSLVIS